MEYTWDNFKRGLFAVVCNTEDEAISFLRLAKKQECWFHREWARNLSARATQCFHHTQVTYGTVCAFSMTYGAMGYCYPDWYVNHIDFTDFCGEHTPSVQIKSLDGLV